MKMSLKLMVSFLLLLVLLFSIPVFAEYPERPITIICFSSAGGGTDTVDRALAAAMEEELGVTVNVVNMPGGMGGIAAGYVWEKPHDGYTLLGASESIEIIPVMAAHHTTTKDWEYFMVMGCEGVVCVHKDSPYNTFNDLIKDMKERPNQIKVAAASAGGIWHIKFALLSKYADIKPKMISYPGSAPSIMACLAKEVDVVHVSTGEAASYVEAGQFRPLVMVEKEAFLKYPNLKVPPITDFYPDIAKELPVPQWLGAMIPSDTPKPIIETLNNAFIKAMESKKIDDLAKLTYATKHGLYGESAKKMAQKIESQFCWTLQDLGIAEKSPALFDIPKP